MTSLVWREVDADVDSMIRHFIGAASIHERRGSDARLWDYDSTMALLHSMQSGYTSAEAALLRILSILREDRPLGPDWHQLLIRRLADVIDGEFARPALLSPELAAAFQTARGFRHRAMHVYDEFDISLFPPALAAAQTMLDLLPGEIAAFRAIVDD